ncbi:unnamed protein product (macronuclear) [Paramecium tetraurelia]|uniref:Uncharacterized protein n=1 Tax=Paramecium tetraurelia TaxID=5888 RepID=A0CWQ0_PARTE|nr:uncharacterized protein GSPATT00001420001 [Paramecium tetraurelia]CAK75217.1 unnamed protein product [Paramecium tetraurelia]|eukprot:XP_001442614.1 hypothetical protein (macronuclear) [Paramecium tetraurelia strain d4-2]
MLVNQQSKVNKENLNPLLIVNQQEQLKLNGILPKNHFNQGITNRYQSTVSCYQQSLTKSPSSTTLQEQIERIVEKLKQKQEKETLQQNVDINKYSIDEMIDILKNDRLLHIRSLQIQPSSNKNRQNSPKTIFPPLQLKQNFQSFETTKSSENETTTHKFSLKPQFHQLPKPKPIQKKESKDIIKPPEESRKKRTISLVIDPPPKKIQMALQNTHRIVQLCSQFNINNITNEELHQLIKTEGFKLQFECLVQFSNNNNLDCRAQLQNFMTSQIKKYKDLRNAELEHQLQKENFNNTLEVCLTKLKSKF